MRTSNVETLLIGGDARLRDAAADRDEGAAAAPAERPPGRAARVSATRPTSGRYQPEAGTPLVNTFLDSGRGRRLALHAARTVDFTPERTQTALAQGHRRRDGRPRAPRRALAAAGWPGGCTGAGGFGRKASAVLRSRLPARARPGRLVPRRADRPDDDAGVPLDDELLAGLSIGAADRARHLPRLGAPRLVGRGRRPSGSRRRSAARSSAPGSGSTPRPELLALITTIVGAAAGGNLDLIVLDIAWDRSARDRFAEPLAAPALASARA